MTATVLHGESNGLRWLSRMLWAGVLVALLYLVGLTAWLGIAGLLFPYQLDYGDGLMLHFVKQWSQGLAIYKTAAGYPYITANYPPLVILLALLLAPVLGITYAAGRIWTLLAIVAVAGVLAAWVWRETRRWLLAVLAALLFAGAPYIYHWAPLFRVDLVGLALSFSGLYVVWRMGKTARSESPLRTGARLRWEPWLAVLLFLAGLYAKQSFLFAPAAALLYLFFFVSRRQAVWMALAMAVVGGGLFLAINAVTHGGFWFGLVGSNALPFSWPEFWRQQANFFRTFAVLGLLAAWYVVDKFLLDRSAPLRDRVGPQDLYLLAALVSLWFAGKAGSWENYFFEALVVFVLCGSLGLARLADRFAHRPVRLLLPLLLLGQVALIWHSPQVAIDYLRLTRRSNEQMQPILAQTSDPIISEDMGLLVTNGKILDYCAFQYSQLARAGRYDQSWELGQLRTRRLKLVILEQGTRLDVDRYQRFTRDFLSELDLNYRHARTVGKYELYEPDPLQHAPQAGRPSFGDRLSLAGWSVHTAPLLRPGDTVTVTVVWQAQQKLAASYTSFAHLADEGGRGWAGDDHVPYGGLYPTTAWGAGEMVRDAFTLTVPPDAPPGLYSVEVGWYSPETQDRLPVEGATAFRVAVLAVDWDPAGAQGLSPLDVRFGDHILLAGAGWQVRPPALQVTLRWSVDSFVDTSYTVFVHLVAPNSSGPALAQGDAPPLGGTWPTLLWQPGLALDDVHTIELPVGLPPGTYDLLVGLYDPATGERLRLPDGIDAVRLTGIVLP